MDTRYGGVVFALKEGNRVEIKFAAWLCRSFHQISASQNHWRSANIQEHERQRAAILMETRLNLTLPTPLNKVPKAR
jgi:hypothetical protein